MARVNLERRAEIGLEKRNRTRAAILDAARACYAAPKAAPVTVDAVMQAAGLAKGTFYVHFADLGAMEAELGEALTEELDLRLQPARLAADHPLTRLATALTVLLRDLARSPAQARLVARAASEIPDVANAMQAHLRQDLADAHAAGLLAVSPVELAARIVTAISRQAAQDLAGGPDRRERTPRHRARDPSRHRLHAARGGTARRGGSAPCRRPCALTVPDDDAPFSRRTP